jgi:hypothetical protein
VSPFLLPHNARTPASGPPGRKCRKRGLQGNVGGLMMKQTNNQQGDSMLITEIDMPRRISISVRGLMRRGIVLHCAACTVQVCT